MTKTILTDRDIHRMLAERREIAIIWSVEDVLEVRPDLSMESAWAVLERCKSCHDATIGICWDIIQSIADQMFPEVDGGSHA